MKKAGEFIRKIVESFSRWEAWTGFSYVKTGNMRNDSLVEFLTRTVALTLLISSVSTVAFAVNGEVVYPKIPAPSLENNLLGTPSTQEIAVYLPPTYNSTDNRYPVLYFLPGFGESIRSWTEGEFQGFKMGTAMNTLLSGGEYGDMIVVIISGMNFLGGSFYVNSPVSGNWEDFIVNDVAGFIDSNYRTIKQASSRGLGGFSMGGYGALNLAMHHPDIFSVVYSMSPGLFDRDGLATCQLFKSTAFIKQYLAKESALNTLSALQTYIAGRYSSNDWDTPFIYAYGAAFSPDSSRDLPCIAYPYALNGDSLVKNDEIWERYTRGFGGLEEKVDTWGDNLRRLKLLTIDYGTSDPYRWIPKGCVCLSGLLTAAKIPHELASFSGGHGDRNKTRMETVVLPYFLKNLDHEIKTGVLEGKESKSVHPRASITVRNYPNPFNPSTNIQFILPAPGFAALSIYSITGQKVRDLLAGNLSAGVHTVVWDGCDRSGEPVSSGVYFSRISSGKIRGTAEMALTR